MMAMISRLLRSFQNRPDMYVAAGGVLFGIAVFFVLSFKIPDYRGTGITLAVACAVYLLLAVRREIPLEFPPFRSGFTLPILNILFLGLSIYSVLVLHSSAGGRPLGYFISIALMGTLVALEAATTPPEAKARQALILAKIIFIALSLRWSLYYVFPGSYLGTDPWRNAVTFNQVLETGHMMPEIGGYYYMPVLHLVVSVTAQVTGVAVREAALLSISLFEVLSLLFIFLLGRQIFSAKFGLLAALLLAVNNLHVMWGWWLVAQTAGIALLALALFLVFTPQYRDKAVWRVLAMITLITVIITHSVSSFVLLVILLLLYGGGMVYRRAAPGGQGMAPGNLLIFYMVALLGYWLYIAKFFPEFLRMIWGIGPEFGAPIAFTPSLVTSVNPAWSETNRLGNLLYYGLAAVGLLTSLNPKNTSFARFNLVFVGVILTALIYTFFTLFDIEVMIGRWFVFLDVVLAAPAAVGLIFLAGSLSARWAKPGVLAALAFLLVFLMITNTTASFDSPLYPVYLKDRTALTVPELAAASTLSAISSDNIVMDYEHNLALAGQSGLKTVNLSAKDIQNHFENVKGMLVLREYAVESMFIAMGDEGIYKARINYDPYRALEDRGFSRVYDNGSVSGYSR